MRTTKLIHLIALAWSRPSRSLPPLLAVFMTTFFVFAVQGGAVDLKVMKMGLGSGTVTSSAPGISCGTDCDEPYSSAVSVTLTVMAGPDSTFVRWDGDCSGAAATCTITMSAARSVRAVFDLSPAIPPINASDISPGGIQAY